MANQGIAAPAYLNQLNSINQNQANAVRALGRSANPGAGLAGIVRQGNEATASLNAQDAIARNRNMLQLLQERQQLSQQKDKAWDWNYRQKYLGNLAKSQALKTSANENLSSGLSDISGTALATMKLGAGQKSQAAAKAAEAKAAAAAGSSIGYGLGQGIGYGYDNDQNALQDAGRSIGQGIEAQY